MKKNINDLIIKFQQGDKSSFGEIVKQMHQYIFKVSLKFVRSIEDAEDLTQEVLLKLYNSLEKFEFRADLKTYLYRMIVNLSSSYYKKIDKLQTKLPEIAEKQIKSKSIETKWEEEKEMWKLENAISGLPKKYKEIIFLKDFEEMSYRDISRKLNITENAAKMRHFHALKRLKTRFKVDTKKM